jgi:hypothetical protein
MNFRAFNTFNEPFVRMHGRKPEAAVDGQLGSIVWAYWEWLSAVQPGVKRTIDFASIHWDT